MTTVAAYGRRGWPTASVAMVSLGQHDWLCGRAMMHGTDNETDKLKT